MYNEQLRKLLASPKATFSFIFEDGDDGLKLRTEINGTHCWDLTTTAAPVRWASVQVEQLERVFNASGKGHGTAQPLLCLLVLSRMLPALAATLLDPLAQHKLDAVQDVLMVFQR